MILKTPTSSDWVQKVLENFDSFLIDHAHAEKKASGMAMSMVSHYPDKPDIVKAMVDLALEEMIHFKQVMKILANKQLTLIPDEKDIYVNNLRKLFRKGTEFYLMDRLIIGGIIEARGAERFQLIANALSPGKLKQFYLQIAASEEKHYELFFELAKKYFSNDAIAQRTEFLLAEEAQIVNKLPLRALLH